MTIRMRNVDPVPQGTGAPSQQYPQGSYGQQGYLKTLPNLVGTILFFPDSESPTLIGVNINPNANPNATNWKIYQIVYNPTNPGFYTSIVSITGSWTQALAGA